MGKKNELIDRTGEVSYNKYGSKMTIVKYINALNIIVGFENGYTVKSDYDSFAKRKNIKSPYDITVGGVGYLGEGKYIPSKNGKHTKEYGVWKDMIDRCYDKNRHSKTRGMAYKDCEICKEWLCFQDFAQWYNDNYYEVNGEKMCVDKDILVKGNKIYSPQNCIIVPHEINELFVKNNKLRGQYPIGVSKDKYNEKYQVVFRKKGKQVYYGKYDTIEQAFNTYKLEKEKHIKQIADEYKPYIPKKLYNAMYKWKVEITD